MVSESSDEAQAFEIRRWTDEFQWNQRRRTARSVDRRWRRRPQPRRWAWARRRRRSTSSAESIGYIRHDHQDRRRTFLGQQQQQHEQFSFALSVVSFSIIDASIVGLRSVLFTSGCSSSGSNDGCHHHSSHEHEEYLFRRASMRGIQFDRRDLTAMKHGRREKRSPVQSPSIRHSIGSSLHVYHWFIAFLFPSFFFFSLCSVCFVYEDNFVWCVYEWFVFLALKEK